MLLRSLRFLFPAAVVLAFASRAGAQEGQPEPEPGVEPGSNALPPEPPQEVPPPPDPSVPPAGPGTTSSGVLVEPAHGASTKPASADSVKYRGGRFVLGHPGGIELSPALLLQTDFYAYAGPGVAHYQRPDGTGLKAGAFLRRARVEIAGRVLEKWYFLLGLQSGGDTTPGPVQPLNNFIGFDASAMLKVQVGQFRIPITMDNVTSIRFGDFMERSLTARVLAAPHVRDLGVMIWGGTDRSAIGYALGYFGGEGANRRSTDNRGDLVARLVLRPLWKLGGNIGQAHIGVSGRYGRRDRTYVWYDAPAMSTPGGYTFWHPQYGAGPGETHVLPSSDQSAVAAELFVPGCCIDFRAEVVAVRDGRREVFAASRGNTERAGTLSGIGYYLQATWWPMGPTRMVGTPGNYGAPTEGFPRARALALSVRWEQIRAKYDSTDRSFDDAGALVAGVRRGDFDAKTTDLKIDALQAAMTYWATHHIRVTAQWSMYRFPGAPGLENQAVAPGALPNNAEEKRSSANVLHEISARVQVSF